jgi:hypothetical protein
MVNSMARIKSFIRHIFQHLLSCQTKNLVAEAGSIRPARIHHQACGESKISYLVV